MGDRPDARPLPTHRTTQHRKTRTHIHASSGIRTHDPSVLAAEDSTCLRTLGHWDRQNYIHKEEEEEEEEKESLHTVMTQTMTVTLEVTDPSIRKGGTYIAKIWP
jgi:hypothetical protein